jgi:hypothetical protein
MGRGGADDGDDGGEDPELDSRRDYFRHYAGLETGGTARAGP